MAVQCALKSSTPCCLMDSKARVRYLEKHDFAVQLQSSLLAFLQPGRLPKPVTIACADHMFPVLLEVVLYFRALAKGVAQARGSGHGSRARMLCSTPISRSLCWGTSVRSRQCLRPRRPELLPQRIRSHCEDRWYSVGPPPEEIQHSYRPSPGPRQLQSLHTASHQLAWAGFPAEILCGFSEACSRRGALRVVDCSVGGGPHHPQFTGTSTAEDWKSPLVTAIFRALPRFGT